ncbi:hypothetical protein D081_2024 [Anaerovibrio sp. JC8]|uniref:hypothetical protein n=1 Tax=Anaerovibrio sp. JC8 TaxID=1240085 RepID=UPI000A0CFEF4|nr:hypothetical protein [Anaerovibrio sp. JC8]ORT99295.1 hypothetical protein D081_2024 [Anaerovibrio sp. JC8]
MDDYINILLSGCYSKDDVFKAFFFNYPEKAGKNFSENDRILADTMLVELLESSSVDEIVSILNLDTTYEEKIESSNVPQYSSLDSIEGIINIVDANPGGTYVDIGYYFNKDGNHTSWSKYGENHYKLTAHLGLVTSSGDKAVTHLGQIFMKLPDRTKADIKTKLFLRVPIVRLVMNYGKQKHINVTDIMMRCLSESTTQRRLPNVKRMILMLIEKSNYKGNYLKNIAWK